MARKEMRRLNPMARNPEVKVFDIQLHGGSPDQELVLENEMILQIL
jgi:hypothetical protein